VSLLSRSGERLKRTTGIRYSFDIELRFHKRLTGNPRVGPRTKQRTDSSLASGEVALDKER
jgi:hypothetical protein